MGPGAAGEWGSGAAGPGDVCIEFGPCQQEGGTGTSEPQ